MVYLFMEWMCPSDVMPRGSHGDGDLSRAFRVHCTRTVYTTAYGRRRQAGLGGPGSQTRGAGLMAVRTVPKARSRSRLSRERVLRAAITHADAGGLEALTMRTLAEELGVAPMAL